MLTLAILALLVAAVAFVGWATHSKRLSLRCCAKGPWPPDDITARATERDAVAAAPRPREPI
jgi:hypothetical protein